MMRRLVVRLFIGWGLSYVVYAISYGVIVNYDGYPKNAAILISLIFTVGTAIWALLPDYDAWRNKTSGVRAAYVFSMLAIVLNALVFFQAMMPLNLFLFIFMTFLIFIPPTHLYLVVGAYALAAINKLYRLLWRTDVFKVWPSLITSVLGALILLVGIYGFIRLFHINNVSVFQADILFISLTPPITWGLSKYFARMFSATKENGNNLELPL